MVKIGPLSIWRHGQVSHWSQDLLSVSEGCVRADAAVKSRADEGCSSPSWGAEAKCMTYFCLWINWHWFNWPNYFYSNIHILEFVDRVNGFESTDNTNGGKHVVENEKRFTSRPQTYSLFIRFIYTGKCCSSIWLHLNMCKLSESECIYFHKK